MRGEEIVVAAELTGKLGHKCFFCSSKHLRKTALSACARSFVNEVFGKPVVSNNVRLPSLNWLEMAKRGQLDRANEYDALSQEAAVHLRWEPDWQDFVMCETRAEAYEIAKRRLAEWRDGAFKAYDNAGAAKAKCTEEFKDLFTPDLSVVNEPKEFAFTKIASTANSTPHFLIDGRTIHLWEVSGFYAKYWQDNFHHGAGRIVDADIVRNMALFERADTSRTGSLVKNYTLVRFLPNRRTKDQNLPGHTALPIESY